MNTASIQIAVIVGLVVFLTLAAYAVVYLLVSLVQAFSNSVEQEPSLLEQVKANSAPQTSLGRLDRDFDRMVHGTMFGFGSDRAAEIILLGAASAAFGAYVLSDNWIAAGLIGVFGALIPLAFLYVFRNRWRRAVQEQLPDACFQLARCLRAGLTIESGFRETATFSQEPISAVFQKGSRLIEGGMTTPNAVTRLADDVRLSDFDTMAALLSLQTDVGGNLPMILDRLAVAVRDRNQYRGYYRSVTALSRITAAFVAIAGPLITLGFWFYQPDLFKNFIEMPLGNVLFGIAIFLWIVGVIWILWLLTGREQY